MTKLGITIVLGVSLAVFGCMASLAFGAERHFPVGQHCWDETMVPTKPEYTVSKTEDLWIIDDPTENVTVTLVPAPEHVKPEEYKGKPGWCMIKMENPMAIRA